MDPANSTNEVQFLMILHLQAQLEAALAELEHKDLRIETLRATAITTAEWYEGQLNERNALIRHMQDDSLVQQETILALRMDNDYMQGWVNELINDQTNSLLSTEHL